MGDSEGRVRKPEALTPHIALDQIWGLEPALAGCGFCPRLRWKRHPWGSPPPVAAAPSGEWGTSGPPPLGSDMAGSRGKGWRRSQRPVPAPQQPPGVAPLGLSSPGRASSGRPCWRPEKKALPRAERTPKPPPRLEQSEGSEVSTACSSHGHGDRAFCSLGYVHGIPEAPHFPGRLKVIHH